MIQNYMYFHRTPQVWFSKFITVRAYAEQYKRLTYIMVDLPRILFISIIYNIITILCNIYHPQTFCLGNNTIRCQPNKNVHSFYSQCPVNVLKNTSINPRICSRKNFHADSFKNFTVTRIGHCSPYNFNSCIEPQTTFSDKLLYKFTSF